MERAILVLTGFAVGAMLSAALVLWTDPNARNLATANESASRLTVELDTAKADAATESHDSAQLHAKELDGLNATIKALKSQIATLIDLKFPPPAAAIAAPPTAPPAAPRVAATPRSSTRLAPIRRSEIYISTGGGHWVNDVSQDGRIVTLEDDSVWEIASFDRTDSTLWLGTEDIVVIDNPGGLSSYKLVNSDTGDVVEADLLSD